MSKGLMIGAAAVALALPLIAVGSAVIALADEEEAENVESSAGAGLNASSLPDAAQKYVPWIKKSAAQCDISPGVLAAQIQQESGWQTHVKSGANAQGIAQFIPSTWAAYGEDSDGDGKASPYDPQDAIMAQGKYMCSLYSRAQKSNYGGDPVKLALAGYNAGWGAVQMYHGVPPYKETSHYVAVITANANKLEAAVKVSGSGAGAKAVRRAATQLGVPYSWGGGDPSGPSDHGAGTKGFDCSSLTQYAYWPSTQLPRVAADQYDATRNHTVSRSKLKAGDLLFWKNRSGIYHVAIYKGGGQIIHAPRTGKNVEVKALDHAMPKDDYFGATRP